MEISPSAIEYLALAAEEVVYKYNMHGQSKEETELFIDNHLQEIVDKASDRQRQFVESIILSMDQWQKETETLT